MTKEIDNALDFLNSARGRYIMSQALYHAIKAMERVSPPHQEMSNIADMRFIRDNLFPFPDAVFDREAS